MVLFPRIKLQHPSAPVVAPDCLGIAPAEAPLPTAMKEGDANGAPGLLEVPAKDATAVLVANLEKSVFISSGA